MKKKKSYSFEYDTIQSIADKYSRTYPESWPRHIAVVYDWLKRWG